MFAEWIVLGSLLFWILLGLISLLLIMFVEEEAGGPGAFVLGLFLVAWLLVGDLPELITTKPWHIAGLAVGYIAIGVAWCWPKWLFLLNRLRIEYKNELARFLKRNNAEEVTEELRESWSSIVESSWKWNYGMSFSAETGKLTPPSFEKNRSRLIVWAAYWPWSMFWTLLRDPIKWIVDLCGELFQKTSEWMFRGFE